MQTIEPVVTVRFTLRNSSGPSHKDIRGEIINRFFYNPQSVIAYFNHFLHGEPLPPTIYKQGYSRYIAYSHPAQSSVIRRVRGYSFAVNLDYYQPIYLQTDPSIQRRPACKFKPDDPRIQCLSNLRDWGGKHAGRGFSGIIVAGLDCWAHCSKLVLMFNPKHPKALFVMEYITNRCIYLSACNKSAFQKTERVPDHRNPLHPVYNILNYMPIMDWHIVRQLTAEAEQKDQVVPFIQNTLYDPNLWYDIAVCLAGESRKIIVTSKSGKTYRGIEVLRGRLEDDGYDSVHWVCDIYMEDGFHLNHVPEKKTQYIDCRCPLWRNPLRADQPKAKKQVSYDELD